VRSWAQASSTPATLDRRQDVGAVHPGCHRGWRRPLPDEVALLVDIRGPRGTARRTGRGAFGRKRQELEKPSPTRRWLRRVSGRAPSYNQRNWEVAGITSVVVFDEDNYAQGGGARRGRRCTGALEPQRAGRSHADTADRRDDHRVVGGKRLRKRCSTLPRVFWPCPWNMCAFYRQRSSAPRRTRPVLPVGCRVNAVA